MSSELSPLRAAGSRLTVRFLRVTGAVISGLPPPVWGLLARVAAIPVWHLARRSRRRAVANLLESGFDESLARRVASASFRSSFLVLFEALAMERIRRRHKITVERVVSEGARRVVEDLRTGKIPLALTVGGHTGSWETAGSELGLLCESVPVAVSARLQGNPVLRDYIVDMRDRWGLELISHHRFMRYLVRHRREGNPRMYCFFTDQHQRRGNRLPVPFFGRSACTVTMPGVLVHKYGAPVLLGNCRREAPGHYVVTFDLLDTEHLRGGSEPDTVRAVTRALSDHIERLIRKAPDQWTWGHRRWRDCCGVPLPA